MQSERFLEAFAKLPFSDSTKAVLWSRILEEVSLSPSAPERVRVKDDFRNRILVGAFVFEDKETRPWLLIFEWVAYKSGEILMWNLWLSKREEKWPSD